MVDKIKLLLKERSVAVSKFCEDVGIAKNAMSEWKSGRIKPGIDTVVKIAEYFGVSTDYLLLSEENPKNNDQPIHAAESSAVVMSYSPVFERIKGLCENVGLSVTSLILEITGSTGNLPTWKKGHVRADYLSAICAKFDVSAEYLLTGKKNNDLPATGQVENSMGYAAMSNRRINKDLAKQALEICLENAEVIPSPGPMARSEFDVSSEEPNIMEFSANTKISYMRIVGFINVALSFEELDDEHYPTLNEMESMYIISDVREDSENITRWENAKKTVERFIGMLEREDKLIKREEADNGINERVQNLENTVGGILGVLNDLAADVGDIRKDTEALEQEQLKKNYVKMGAALGRIQELISA